MKSRRKPFITQQTKQSVYDTKKKISEQRVILCFLSVSDEKKSIKSDKKI